MARSRDSNDIIAEHGLAISFVLASFIISLLSLENGYWWYQASVLPATQPCFLAVLTKPPIGFSLAWIKSSAHSRNTCSQGVRLTEWQKPTWASPLLWTESGQKVVSKGKPELILPEAESCMCGGYSFLGTRSWSQHMWPLFREDFLPLVGQDSPILSLYFSALFYSHS